jgi:hypothetical protein
MPSAFNLSKRKNKLRKSTQLNRLLFLLLICAIGYVLYYFNITEPQTGGGYANKVVQPNIQFTELNNILKKFK